MSQKIGPVIGKPAIQATLPEPEEFATRINKAITTGRESRIEKQAALEEAKIVAEQKAKTKAAQIIVTLPRVIQTAIVDGADLVVVMDVPPTDWDHTGSPTVLSTRSPESLKGASRLVWDYCSSIKGLKMVFACVVDGNREISTIYQIQLELEP